MSDPMPVFTIKAKDKLAVRAVGAYLRLCQELGLDDQAAQVELALVEIDSWRRRNPGLVKLPDHEHVPATAAESPFMAAFGAASDAVEATDTAGAAHGREGAMKPISLDERDLLKRDRVAEAFYETWAAEMRQQRRYVPTGWADLSTATMRAWAAVVQLADDRAAVGRPRPTTVQAARTSDAATEDREGP